MIYKVVDAKRKVNNLNDGFHRDIFDSFANIRHNVDLSLLVVCSCLRELIGSEAIELQWIVHAVIRDAARGVQKTLVGAPEVVDRSLTLIFGHAMNDESVRARSSTTRSAICESRRGRTRATSDSGNVPKCIIS